MGLFNRKPDPISERAKALKDEIARIESQIKDLNAHVAQTKAQPRLRSTAKPPGATAPLKPAPPASHEPVFEEVDQKRLQNLRDTRPPPAPHNALGVRKFDLVSLWKRLARLFRPPAPSNPKLLNLLAAGNIQGLRPLRYEKRVARNRFIALVVLFFLALWGIIGFFLRHR
jgi:hypothetical protein